jgi:transcriptional regulator with XRE-family HTH domain
MGHLERGEKNVSFSTLVRVATALGVSLRDLFAGLETVGSSPVREPTRRDQEIVRDRVTQAVVSLERTLKSLRQIVNSPMKNPRKRAKPR